MANNRKKLVAGFFIASVLIVGGVFAYRHFDNPPKAPDDDTAKTTSDATTAQPDFSEGGNERGEPGNTLQENQGSGTIQDTGGADSQTSGDPVKSDTGEITINSPGKNSLLSSGRTISGVSSLDTVSYRIIDDISGVIATGRLQVKNGKFSGKITFETGAENGRLDFFGTKNDLTEFSNVEIPVRFR